MQDGSFSKEDRSLSGGHLALAFGVIERLAKQRHQGVRPLKDTLLSKMVEAVRAPEVFVPGDLLDEFRAARVPMAQIADIYIPETARNLGVAWERDQASFAEVTVGVSRLHDLLHNVQSGWGADTSSPGTTSAVVLIVPPAEQHTLGALIAASSLRRLGISVAVRFAPGLSDLSALLANRQFDAALVTVGSQERLEMCAKLVKTLKQVSKGSLRIAVGGAVASQCRAVLTEAGADLVTNDVSTVVSEFRL